MKICHSQVESTISKEDLFKVKWYLNLVNIIYDKYSKLETRKPNHERFYSKSMLVEYIFV